jgi:hypothetical protein
MRKLLIFIGLLFVALTTYSQNNLQFKLSSVNGATANSSVTTNINGQPLKKGDNFVVFVLVNGNGNTTARSIFFDLEFQNTAYSLVSIAHTGTGGNGGILPSSTSIQLSTSTYPGYAFHPTSSNTTSEGYTNYINAGYDIVQSKTIIRSSLTWASASGMPYSNYSGMLKLTFNLNSTASGSSWDPIKLNFAAVSTNGGASTTSDMVAPLSTSVDYDVNAYNYLNATMDVNSSLTSIAPLKVAFTDSVYNVTHLYDITSNGVVNVDQTQLLPNTVYRVMALVSMDKLYDIYNAAVTVSDFTNASGEFTSQNLNGTYSGENMAAGASYLASDVNYNNKLDGGDLPVLLAAAVGLDTLVTLPPNYQLGSNGYMNTYVFTENEFNTLNPTSFTSSNNHEYVRFKTGPMGSNTPLKLKYLLFGDINRSHSSQVYDASGVVTKSTNLINTPNDIQSIDVTLSNTTVTSNNISIPVNLDTQGNSVSALQFEFDYDPSKVKFDQISSSLPNTWFVFANSKDGRIKFGAIDKGGSTPITSSSTPFTLKFSSIGNGVDLVTSIKVSHNMDASDKKGNQLGINLNTTTIKLTGYNKF